jgi:hypothetical protein
MKNLAQAIILSAQAIVFNVIFKKSLTSGGAAGSEVVVDASDGDPDRQILLGDSSFEIIPNLPVSAVIPISSLTAARAFARRFIKWCASNGIHGPTDLPRVLILSNEFAEFENIRPVTKMALSKALTGLGLTKYMREIADHERGPVSKRRSDATRSRVTVYILPGSDAQAQPNDNNVPRDLFD